MKALNDSMWKTTHSDKNLYASKCAIKIKYEGGTEILKHESVVINYQMEIYLEDNYNNNLQPKLVKKALYCKDGDLLYNTVHGQLHSDSVVHPRTLPILFMKPSIENTTCITSIYPSVS